MTERSLEAWTETRRRLYPGDTTVPVMAVAPFNLGPGKIVVGDEEVEYEAVGTDPNGGAAFFGVTGISRSWPAETRVIQRLWTTVEEVSELPAPTAEMAYEGRLVVLPAAGTRPTTLNWVEIRGGVPEWIALNLIGYRDAVLWEQSIGGVGTGNGLFQNAGYVAVSPVNGDVYATDYTNGKVHRFNAAGGWLQTWTGFNNPEGIAVEANGNVFVAERGLDRIHHYTASGSFIKMITSSFLNIYGLHVSPFDGTLWVADASAYNIKQFNPTTGVLLRTIQEVSPQFPIAVAVRADDGVIFVLDHFQGRVRTYSNAGILLGEWGTQGSGAGQLDDPYDLAFGPDGDLWVTSYLNDRVDRFHPDGTWVQSVGRPGNKNGLLDRPVGIAWALDGQGFWTGDFGNHKVHRFSVGEGRQVREIAVGGVAIASRPQLNLVGGDGITIAGTDSDAYDAADVTVSSFVRVYRDMAETVASSMVNFKEGNAIDLTLGADLGTGRAELTIALRGVTVRETNQNVTAGTVATDTRDCNSTEILIGGGCLMGSPTNADLRRSGATAVRTWGCTMRNGAGTTQTMTTQAICLQT